MATPTEHIEKVEAMVASLLPIPSVSQAWVNDWGRHSNFSVHVSKRKGFPLGFRHAINAMKRFCKENGMIYRGHYLPGPKDYHQVLSVDIDFIPYDPGSNTFEGVKPEDSLAEMNQMSLF